MNMPLVEVDSAQSTVDECVQKSELDWLSYERSWDFQSLHLLKASDEPKTTLESSYTAWITENKGTIAENLAEIQKALNA